MNAPPEQPADVPASPVRSALVEAAVEELALAGRPLSLQHLVRSVLHVRHGPVAGAVAALEPLLRADARLEPVDAAGHWGLASWARRDQALEAVEFVVCDVETNGGRGGRHRVLEVGALRLRGGTPLAEYDSLVRIRGRVSRFVERYTGITDELVADAPPIDTVLAEFREFQAGGVLVAHNLAADLGYLNRESIWAGQPLFPGDGWTTAELVAALMPDVPGAGLSAALTTAGIAEPPRHRAMVDARVTAALFAHLCHLAKARGIATLDGLQQAAATAAPEQAHPERVRALARWASRNLPPAPGVYVFRDAADAALYVGKTVSLQRRVRGHFTDSAGFVRRRPELLNRIERIEWETTGSELLALLREVDLIERLKPLHNVQLQRRVGASFVRVGPPEAATVQTATVVRDDGGEHIGPYRTARDAQLAAIAVRRIFGLPSIRSPVKQVAPWRRRAAVAHLVRGSDAARAEVEAAEVPPEVGQDLLRTLRRTRAHRRPIRGGLGGDSVLIVA
ncbi:MAG: GIY-YIG nuclease family protein, partial [Actinobacteria bacterium]|nr:GIY-YIG nuclease family protein [Actinomycetota bacterium]